MKYSFRMTANTNLLILLALMSILYVTFILGFYSRVIWVFLHNVSDSASLKEWYCTLSHVALPFKLVYERRMGYCSAAVRQCSVLSTSQILVSVVQWQWKWPRSVNRGVSGSSHKSQLLPKGVFCILSHRNPFWNGRDSWGIPFCKRKRDEGRACSTDCDMRFRCCILCVCLEYAQCIQRRCSHLLRYCNLFDSIYNISFESRRSIETFTLPFCQLSASLRNRVRRMKSWRLSQCQRFLRDPRKTLKPSSRLWAVYRFGSLAFRAPFRWRELSP